MGQLGDALKVKRLRTWLVALIAPPETKEIYTLGDFFAMFIPMFLAVMAFQMRSILFLPYLST